MTSDEVNDLDMVRKQGNSGHDSGGRDPIDPIDPTSLVAQTASQVRSRNKYSHHYTNTLPKLTFTTIGTSGAVTNVAGHYNVIHGDHNEYHIAGTSQRQFIDRYIVIIISLANCPHHLPPSPPPSQPEPPKNFCGRDEPLSKLSAIIFHTLQPRIAILGSGGMGKTSIALHLIRNETVIARYKDCIYFLPCDALTSAESLAAQILQMLGVAAMSTENIITAMHRALKNSPPTLLLLDNFDSIWDAPDAGLNRNSLRDILQKIAGVPSAALIITMRASVPPPGIAWTVTEILPPLSPSSARDVFLKINDCSLHKSINDHKILDELLHELDYVPLAIHLLAQVSIGFPLAFSLKRWRDEKTGMLCMDGMTLDKLESVDVSIAVSITAMNIARNPHAIQLLGMLCLLPDGLFSWQDRLDIIMETGGARAVTILKRFVLINVMDDKLAVLSPIRHFILRHHPPNHHAKRVYDLFWKFAMTHLPIEYGTDFKSAVDSLRPEMGNLESLIDDAVNFHPSPNILHIATILSQHLCRTQPSTNLLDKVAQLVPQVPLEFQAEYWRTLGDIYRKQHQYAEAREALTRAQDQFFDLGNRLEASHCLVSLGDVFSTQGDYAEATRAFTQSRQHFIDVGNSTGIARCSWRLGSMLGKQGDYAEATRTLRQARDHFVEAGDHLGAAQSLRSMGNVLRMQNEFSAAADALTEAGAHFLKMGNDRSAAQCSQDLGDIQRLQNKLPEAVLTLGHARAQFLKIGYYLEGAQCARSLGRVLLEQRRHAEAKVILTEAHDLFIAIDQQEEAAESSQYLHLCEFS